MKSKKCTPLREHPPRLRPGLFCISRSGRFHRRDARGRCAARVWTCGFQRARPVLPGMAPRLLALRGTTTGLAAPGCARGRRPRCWRSVGRLERRWFTDRPDAMLTFAAAICCCSAAPMRRDVPPCLRGSAGLAFGRAESMPEGCCCGEFGCARHPLRGQVRSLGLVLAVNPGAGTAHAPCVRCASGLFAATGLPDKFPRRVAASSRGKFLGPAGPLLALRPAVRRARTRAVRITAQGRDGRGPGKPRKESS